MAIIYTNNSSGAIRRLKSKKPTKLYLLALEKHIKWLRSKGFKVNDNGKIILSKRKTVMSLGVSNSEKPVQEVKTSNYMGNGKQISWKEKQERLEVSKQYSIAPAYNKGPYMVVAKEDIKTAGRKV
jgi:hypothetical protein